MHHTLCVRVYVFFFFFFKKTHRHINNIKNKNKNKNKKNTTKEYPQKNMLVFCTSSIIILSNNTQNYGVFFVCCVLCL